MSSKRAGVDIARFASHDEKTEVSWDKLKIRWTTRAHAAYFLTFVQRSDATNR